MKPPALPDHQCRMPYLQTGDRDISPELEASLGRAKTFAKNSVPRNTSRAFESDWQLFAVWCDRMSIDPSTPNPEFVAAYLSDMVSGYGAPRKNYAVSSIERHLSSICWRYRSLGTPLDRRDIRISAVMRGIKASYWKPAEKKEPLLTEDIRTILGLMDYSRIDSIRDRAIILIGFAGALRRSEIVGMDVSSRQHGDTDPKYKGWIEVHDQGLLLTIRNKGEAVRQIEIGRASSENVCPRAAYLQWLHLGRISAGPAFRRIRSGGTVTPDRLSDGSVAQLVKKLATRAGLGAHLKQEKRKKAFSGHSLRSGFATSAKIETTLVQKQLGHAKPETTDGYIRRRDRFITNMTKATGL